mmetsp:Transcript_22283/g.65698  ORF Transcript_22283/g.65698 Transcript_22283/m.65698 type:complete len:224 (-) Transcript_22283:46-717(-)
MPPSAPKARCPPIPPTFPPILPRSRPRRPDRFAPPSDLSCFITSSESREEEEDFMSASLSTVFSSSRRLLSPCTWESSASMLLYSLDMSCSFSWRQRAHLIYAFTFCAGIILASLDPDTPAPALPPPPPAWQPPARPPMPFWSPPSPSPAPPLPPWAPTAPACIPRDCPSPDIVDRAVRSTSSLRRCARSSRSMAEMCGPPAPPNIGPTWVLFARRTLSCAMR